MKLSGKIEETKKQRNKETKIEETKIEETKIKIEETKIKIEETKIEEETKIDRAPPCLCRYWVESMCTRSRASLAVPKSI